MSNHGSAAGGALSGGFFAPKSVSCQRKREPHPFESSARLTLYFVWSGSLKLSAALGIATWPRGPVSQAALSLSKTNSQCSRPARLANIDCFDGRFQSFRHDVDPVRITGISGRSCLKYFIAMVISSAS